MLNLLSYPDLRDGAVKSQFNAACIAIKSDVNIADAIVSGGPRSKGLLPGWLEAIDGELRSPDSQFDKKELSLVYTAISQIIETLSRGATQTQDD